MVWLGFCLFQIVFFFFSIVLSRTLTYYDFLCGLIPYPFLLRFKVCFEVGLDLPNLFQTRVESQNYYFRKSLRIKKIMLLAFDCDLVIDALAAADLPHKKEQCCSPHRVVVQIKGDI